MPKNYNTKNLLASISEMYGQDGRFYQFGIQDNFPNLLAEYVNNSGTARSCVDRLNQFLIGTGFQSQAFMESKANGKETWAELLDQIGNQTNYFSGLSIQVKFDAAGRPARYYAIGTQHLRKRVDGLFIYNPDLGDPLGFNTMRRWSNFIIPAYRIAQNEQEELEFAAARRQMVDEQISQYGEQLGEILYVYKKGIGLNYDKYGVPSYSAGLGDLAADAGLSETEDNLVSNQFKGDVVITTHVMNRELKDEDGLTEQDRFEGSIEGFTGPDGSSVLNLQTDLTAANLPKVEVLNNQHKMDATEQASDRIAKKVCRWFSVPPVLVGIDTAGKLGDNQELVNKLKLFNLTLDTKRALIHTAMMSLFPDISMYVFELQRLDLFDHIPKEVIARLTTEQVNEIYNIPKTEGETLPATDVDGEEPSTKTEGEEAKEIKEVNEILTNLTAKQAQEMDRIIRKFNKGQLSEGQALIRLTSFGMDDETGRKYLDIQDEGIDN